MKTITLVFAGNYDQYCWYLRENKIDIQDRNYRYVTRMSQVVGFRNPKIVKVGTWFDNSEAREAYRHVETYYE